MKQQNKTEKDEKKTLSEKIKADISEIVCPNCSYASFDIRINPAIDKIEKDVKIFLQQVMERIDDNSFINYNKFWVIYRDNVKEIIKEEAGDDLI